MRETERIADQLVRALEGDTWTGRSVRDVVADLTAAQATWRPAPGANNGWELLGHIGAWLEASRIRLGGQEHEPTPEENFPAATKADAESWNALWDRVRGQGHRLAEDIARLPDHRLEETVPGKEYNVYHLLHGVIQHSLYHAGQIALVARLAKGSS